MTNKTSYRTDKCNYYKTGWCELVEGARCLHQGDSEDCSFIQRERQLVRNGLQRFRDRYPRYVEVRK